MSDRIKQVKVVLIIVAVCIAAASLLVSHKLIRDLQQEEIANMEIWAEAMRSFNTADEHTDLGLVLRVLEGNTTIPVIVVDSRNEVVDYRNIALQAAHNASDTTAILLNMAQEMQRAGCAIRLNLDATESAPADYLWVCYDKSIMLTRLSQYPYVQLGVVGLFVVIAIIALLSSKRAEQNKVWVGLSKETAHQLGTPISSLMAWTEVLREQYPEETLIGEMGKDVERLQLIAERFSKIGSAPELHEEDLRGVVDGVVDYIRRRTSDKVAMRCDFPDGEVKVMACAPLLEWVIEVLCKNAIDAMAGSGSITVKVAVKDKMVTTYVADTGKGIPRSLWHTVFRPGYTTKRRGWGLGLSLARRIVEEYHHGNIYISASEIGRGTTFAIELRGHNA